MILPKRLAPAAYLVAFALVAIPLFDAMMSTMPPHVHDPRWRFGTVGVVSNAMLFPALGALVALAAAIVFEHWRTRRVLGALSFVVAGTCLAVMGLFILDALQTHGGVRADLQRSFAIASATVVVKLIISAATFVALGIAGARTVENSAAKPVSRPMYPIVGHESVAPTGAR